MAITTIQCIFGSVVVLSLLIGSSAQYEDDRCKCVCPKIMNGTDQGRVVYKKNVIAQYCKCEYVVSPPEDLKKEFCPRCECKYESRNTTTIKVVVIFIVCIVSLLFVYMIFLLCLDPLMNRRPRHSYSPQRDEINLDDQTVGTGLLDTSSARPRTIINKVENQQKKWQRNVKEQRRNIYDRHTMLN